MKNLPSYLNILIISTIVNIAFLLIRNAIIGNTIYNFLLWNLFLGIIPFVVAYCLADYYANLKKWLLWAGSGFWLLFYPNAPYMITDIIHIQTIQGSDTVLLYDSLLIFSLGMLSTFFGFYSMAFIYGVWKIETSQLIAKLIVTISILLSSFGIYLGRVLRLNSWDIFTKPLATFETIFHHLFPITANPSTYVAIVVFSWVQLMLLLLIVDMDKLKPNKLR